VAYRGWKSGLVDTAMIHCDLGAEPVERRYDVRAYEISAADDEHSHARIPLAYRPNLTVSPADR
jgi:hypothetical protein